MNIRQFFGGSVVSLVSAAGLVGSMAAGCADSGGDAGGAAGSGAAVTPASAVRYREFTGTSIPPKQGRAALRVFAMGADSDAVAVSLLREDQRPLNATCTVRAISGVSEEGEGLFPVLQCQGRDGSAGTFELEVEQQQGDSASGASSGTALYLRGGSGQFSAPFDFAGETPRTSAQAPNPASDAIGLLSHAMFALETAKLSDVREVRIARQQVVITVGEGDKPKVVTVPLAQSGGVLRQATDIAADIAKASAP